MPKGLTLGIVSFKPGDGGARHIHFKSEEILYVLEGRVKQSWGDNYVILEEGDTFGVERGVPHHAENIGDELARAVVVYDSAVRDYVKELDYEADPEAFPEIRVPLEINLE
ncbi:cupin domain-containing protein [Pelagicoccus sp. SDUM812002]|uniref:cupin domain-containing protein n=1 Tax=Pelagicoccus sp. SDUM812002 TaxID=3041266 RepID=UPI0028101434|nr:cupin domain-containing protein [Pelagicoccus sp. SDUM812002]MDQ8184197.1 cupin domain-containing protein [Pelagicoccus sp. SDUM812002]